MSLSSSTVPRVLKHTRTITVEAYARDDGLWDLDAHSTDIKNRDGQMVIGTQPFQIDRCHAMRADGAAVAQYYPRWAVPPAGP